MTAAMGAQQSGSSVADAAMRGDKAAVSKLLKDGADVNGAQGDGMSALHWAAERGDAELADMLIYAGANIGAVTRIGQYTPLHLAAKSGSAAVAKALIKAGADVNAKTTNSGVTPLHLAASSGSAEVINLLADAKADINAKEAEAGTDAADLRRRPQPRRGDQGAAGARRRCRVSTTKVIDVAEVQRARSRRRRSAAQGDRRLRRQGFRSQGRRRARSPRRSKRAARSALRQDSAARSERAGRSERPQLQSRKKSIRRSRPRAA